MDSKEQLQELEEKVSLGLQEAYKKMVEFKKRNNSPIIISRNGKVVSVSADSVPPTTKSKN